MRITLRGALAGGGAPRTLELSLGGAATREQVLAALAEQVPAVRRYLAMPAEAGVPPSLLVLSGGRWVHPGDVLQDQAEVEVYPPTSGG
jgi:hypothetical protein